MVPPSEPKDGDRPEPAREDKPREERSRDEHTRDEAHDEPDPRDRDRSFRRLGDQLFSSLLGEPTAAFKRGQGLVTGVAQGTKEELVRMISAEVRSFLDKMDAADLVQEIVSGLVIEMKTEIRFRRSEDGRLEPDIRTSEAKLGHEDDRKGDDRKGDRTKGDRTKGDRTERGDKGDKAHKSEHKSGDKGDKGEREE